LSAVHEHSKQPYSQQPKGRRSDSNVCQQNTQSTTCGIFTSEYYSAIDIKRSKSWLAEWLKWYSTFLASMRPHTKKKIK
jgi:hypothetical protein